MSNYNKTLISKVQSYIIENSLVLSSISSNLSVSSSSITGLRTNFTSPAIYSKGSTSGNYKNTLEITSCNFAMNKARVSAGAVMSIDNDVTIDNSIFQSNEAA